MYIKQQELTRKVKKFMQREPQLLRNYMDLHFKDKLIKLPIETKEGHVFESVFCEGYQHLQYLVAPSTQVGCATQCSFCELGEYGLTRNLNPEEILEQINITLNRAHDRNYPVFSKPLKLTFVTGGDALGNKYFGRAFEMIKEDIPLKTKVSTVFPGTKTAKQVYRQIVETAKEYPNIVQFQVSLNSTDEEYRQSLVKIPLADFDEIREAAETWHDNVPNPRKINLTFTISKETPMNPEDISSILTPDMFAVRFRPWVHTQRGEEHGLEQILNGKLEDTEKRFEDAGYLIIPGKAGHVEYDFRLAPGEVIKLYSQMKAVKGEKS